MVELSQKSAIGHCSQLRQFGSPWTIMASALRVLFDRG